VQGEDGWLKKFVTPAQAGVGLKIAVRDFCGSRCSRFIDPGPACARLTNFLQKFVLKIGR